MGDFAQMQIVDCLDHLFEDDSGILFTKATCLVQSIEQFSSLAQTKSVRIYSETM